MLRPLTTEFKVLGSGFETLKNIKKSYEDLKKSFKSGEKELPKGFSKITNGLGKIKNGTVKVGNAFKVMAARTDASLSKINKKGNNLMSTFKKLTAVIGGGILIKNAFSGAAQLEMTRTAISSMRGEKRAEELMNFGVNFANITPYKTDEVLDAVKKLEIRGLDPTKNLESIGDMAAMLGKPLDQAVEAILDAATGEFERLKEFGITKRDLETKISVGSFDNKGSVINQKKMFDDLMNYIALGYKGGMVKLSRTTTGLLSTIKGIYGSFTNMLFTGSATGNIEENSPLGVFKDKVLQPLADNLIKWQQDGTFTDWSNSFANAFDKVYKALRSTIKIIIKFQDILIGLATAWYIIKLVQTLEAVAAAIAVIEAPVLITIGAIAALTAAFVHFYRTSESFRTIVHSVWEGIKFIVGGIADWIVERVKYAKMMIEDLIKLKNKLVDTFKSIQKFEIKGIEFKTPEEYEELANRPIVFGTPGEGVTNNNVTINVNGGNTEDVKKAIEDALIEKDIHGGKL